MKTLLSSCIILFNLSCSLYESDARVYLREGAFSKSKNTFIESCSFQNKILLDELKPLEISKDLSDFGFISFFKQRYLTYIWIAEEESYLFCKSHLNQKIYDEYEYYNNIKLIIEELNL